MAPSMEARLQNASVILRLLVWMLTASTGGCPYPGLTAKGLVVEELAVLRLTAIALGVLSSVLAHKARTKAVSLSLAPSSGSKAVSKARETRNSASLLASPASSAMNASSFMSS